MTETGPEPGRTDELPFPPALGCLLSVLLGLVAVGIFFATLNFALRGEVRFAAGELNERRVWLIRGDPELGFGLSSAKIVSGGQAEGQACVQTTVRFVMLRSTEDSPTSIEYCECLERVDGRWIGVGACES